MLVEDTEGYVGSSDVPNVDGEIANQARTTGQVIIVPRPPFDPAHWPNGVHLVFKLGLLGVPDFDVLVSAGRG